MVRPTGSMGPTIGTVNVATEGPNCRTTLSSCSDLPVPFELPSIVIRLPPLLAVHPTLGRVTLHPARATDLLSVPV